MFILVTDIEHLSPLRNINCVDIYCFNLLYKTEKREVDCFKKRDESWVKHSNDSKVIYIVPNDHHFDFISSLGPFNTLIP